MESPIAIRVTRVTLPIIFGWLGHSFGKTKNKLTPSPLPEPRKLAPQLRPPFIQSAADENNLKVAPIHNAIPIADLPRGSARGKTALKKLAREPDCDHRLGRRIAIPALPVQIDPADRRGQSVAAAVQINGARCRIVARKHRHAP